MFKRAFGLFAVSFALAACNSKATSDAPAVLALQRDTAAPAFPSAALLHERSGRGLVRYLGMDVKPEHPKRGDVVEITHYFRAERKVSGAYDVFVHGEVPGANTRVLVADHGPVLGQVASDTWVVGQIWADPHRVKIPDDAPSAAIDLWVGLFKGDRRWTVEARAGASDGRDRIRAGRIVLDGPTPSDDLPEVVVPRATAKITPDAVRDEADWAKAPVLRFTDSMGRDVPVRYPTTLRLLYDDENLYVLFESQDADITERFSKRDDPIYDHETVEIFIMPKIAAPEVGPYVELQASPGGVIFDASFEGRRRGMNTKFNAGQTVGTVINGTLNDPSPDTSWVSEWVVPWKGIRGANGAPKPGDEWRMNAYRIEKHNEDGKLKGEFTAWSPPKVGDFHNVVRFGKMKFGR